MRYIYILMYQTEWLHGKGMVTIQGQIVYYPKTLHFKYKFIGHFNSFLN